MPELPEVENVVRTLAPLLHGRTIESVCEEFDGVFLDAAGVPEPWPRAVVGLRRRAKLIMIELEGDLLLVVHLRMTGSLEVHDAGAPLAKHTHVVIELDRGKELRYRDPRRFGRVRLESTASLAADPFFAGLGPEPLETTAAELEQRVGVGRGAIKAALLDQRRLAGIGNIYADEILYACGLHPGQPANTVLPREFLPMLAHMQRILGSAIRGGGSTIRDYRSPDGQAGSFQSSHEVFGRTGQPCPGCATPIRKIRVAGRGTHFCPRCQPLRRRKPRRQSSSRTT